MTTGHHRSYDRSKNHEKGQVLTVKIRLSPVAASRSPGAPPRPHSCASVLPFLTDLVRCLAYGSIWSIWTVYVRLNGPRSRMDALLPRGQSFGRRSTCTATGRLVGFFRPRAAVDCCQPTGSWVPGYSDNAALCLYKDKPSLQIARHEHKKPRRKTYSSIHVSFSF